MRSFWQLGDELRGQSKVSEDHKWSMVASKLAEQTKGERRINLDLSKGPAEIRPRENMGFQEDNKFESLNFNMLNLDPKMTENVNKSSFRNGMYNMNALYQKSNGNSVMNMTGSKYAAATTTTTMIIATQVQLKKDSKPCLQLRHSQGMRRLVATFLFATMTQCRKI
ncbi:hypothetical protein CsSME_00004664 [Camellia sinensis var. sinensis]